MDPMEVQSGTNPNTVQAQLLGLTPALVIHCEPFIDPLYTALYNCVHG